MDLLRRYQKPGGFLQLVKLIETCTAAKQVKMINIIEKESPRWAEEICNKILSMERICSWDKKLLANIVAHLKELTLSVIIRSNSPEQIKEAVKTLSPAQKRRIDDLANTKDPTPGEVASAHIRIISEVREMINQKSINLPTVDPDLVIEEDIEEKLSQLVLLEKDLTPVTTCKVPTPQLAPRSVTPTKKREHELKIEVTKLRQENQQLKQKIEVLANKLHSVHSIAAQMKKATV